MLQTDKIYIYSINIYVKGQGKLTSSRGLKTNLHYNPKAHDPFASLLATSSASLPWMFKSYFCFIFQHVFPSRTVFLFKVALLIYFVAIYFLTLAMLYVNLPFAMLFYAIFCLTHPYFANWMASVSFNLCLWGFTACAFKSHPSSFTWRP